MLGLLKIKSLVFGLLLASPGLAAWAYLGANSADSASLPHEASVVADAQPHRITVEVIAKGSAPEWVYVQVPPQAIPEPGLVSLLMLTGSILIFRRSRAN